MMLTVFWDVATRRLIAVGYQDVILLMETVNISKTSVIFYQTAWRKI
jgi:hypothetical protein